MAYELQESQVNSNGAAALGSADYRLGQTFKAESSYTLTKVELKLYREGDPPNLIVEIQDTTDGAPNNNVLSTQSIDISAITENTNGEWVEIVFDTPATLTNSTTYAIIVGDGWTDASNRFRWRQNTISDDYPDGSKYYASTGENWIISNYDFTFKSYSGFEATFEGSIVGVLSIDGSLKIITELIGSADGISGADGSLKVATELIGFVAGVSDADGELSFIELEGSVAGVSDALGWLEVSTTMRGSVVETFDVSGWLGFLIFVGGITDGISDVIGFLVSQFGFIGSATETSNLPDNTNY